VTPELAAEIRRTLDAGPAAAGFEIPRHTWYLGRWIDHGGWYPDVKLRLFRKDRGHFGGRDPHDRFLLDSPPGRLRGEIVHFTYRSFAHQLRTIDQFSDVAAREWSAAGRRAGLLPLLFRPAWKFVETYLLKRGFLDGLPGLIISVATAFYLFVKYVKLWELTARIGERRPPSPAAVGEGRGGGVPAPPAAAAPAPSPSPTAVGEGRGEGMSAPPTAAASSPTADPPR
ncbi:MAG: glycosyltransferase family 2 protein, partial [Planctomycetes bacterium]|nr:glycosyltransferase family 2 protein [Planctomycetota bacterium]